MSDSRPSIRSRLRQYGYLWNILAGLAILAAIGVQIAVWTGLAPGEQPTGLLAGVAAWLRCTLGARD